MCLRGLLVLFLGLVFLLPVASLPSRAPSSSNMPIACASILPAAHVQNAPLEKPALGYAASAPRASVPLMMAAKCVFTRATIQTKTATLSLAGSGSVDIATATPAQTLEVNGTAKIDTGLIVPLIYPASDSTTAIQIDKANGTSNVVDIDTTNGRVGIGTNAPGALLDINEASASTTGLNISGGGGAGSSYGIRWVFT
jgi:hypothetical protein